MKTLESPLIANRDKRHLSALGYRQLNRFISKATTINGTHRYSKEAKPLVEQVTRLIHSLIFDHNLTEEQISKLQKSIKVINGQLQLPSIAT